MSMYTRYVAMSAFHLDDQLESINAGASRYDLTQMYPVSGNIINASIGSGGASGLTTFQWQDSVGWWSPYNSYFLLQLQFTKSGSAATGIPIADKVTYCDNLAPTLFTQIQTQIDSRPLDAIIVPWIIDTALTYSKGHNSFLRTWGSLTRIGESLQSRLQNVSAATEGGNNGYLEVVFRPCVSLFDAKVLPPGPQFKIDFNWASSAILAFESLNGSITAGNASGNYNINVMGFSFFKAVLQPEYVIETPSHGVVELCPTQAQQYFINGGNALRQQISVPGTTNKVYIVFQDNSSNTVAPIGPATVVKNLAGGVGTGYQPATSFTHRFVTTLTNPTFSSNLASINQLWLDFPELGITAPKPIYNIGSQLNSTDLLRAYSDFCHISQGTHDQMEGSCPFGNYNPAIGTNIIALATDTPSSSVLQAGIPENAQQFIYYVKDVAANIANSASATAFNQTARWGWSGRCPGPIFAFAVVRPENKLVSTGTLNVTTNPGADTLNALSISATVLSCYSMAIVCQKQANGLYSYTLVQSV